MFDESLTLIALVVLTTLSAGGIAYGLLFSRVQNETAVARRVGALASKTNSGGDRKSQAEIGARRKDIQESIRELEAKQVAASKNNKNPPLNVRIQQAGLRWTKRTFLIISIVSCIVYGVIGLLLSGKLLVAIGAGIVGGLGFPRWIVNYRRKSRINKFMQVLPNAVDIITRGLKSGLPLGDCLRIISTECEEPLRSEFKTVVETQQLGMPLSEAVTKLFDRVPTQEVSFFATVIAIQSKSGGNLSEALGNLSRVLRDRKKMKAKINAMSMEAKSSAGIIGSLPFVVSILVYLASPKYIMILFETRTGNMIMIAGLIYMFIGILVMRKMINFDF